MSDAKFHGPRLVINTGLVPRNIGLNVVDNATHVTSASARLLILGGVEKGRGGIFSPISRIDGGPHRRTAIGNMSGISSGTGETGRSFVLLSAACACGKYDARGVGVGEDATSTGVLVSAPSNRSLVCMARHLNVTQRTFPWVSIRAVVGVGANTILGARADFPFRARR